MKVNAFDFIKRTNSANRSNFTTMQSRLMFLCQAIETNNPEIIKYHLDKAKEYLDVSWLDSEFDLN